jgi:hypothetical protein
MIEPLEDRRLFATTPWGTFPQLIDQDLAVANYPQYNGAGQTIAIIDTGVDYTHPALVGKYLAGHDFVDNDNDPMDFDGHGTALASLAIGNAFTFNGAKYQGIAPSAKVVALRVDDGGDVPDSRYEAAFQWIIANRQTYNITAINLSFGSGHFTTEAARAIYADEMAQLAADGVFIAAASGNDGAFSPYGLEYPAADPSVFAIGGIDNGDTIWKSTERGPNMDLLAPGVNVPTAYLDPTDQSPTYLAATGTSFSSPIACGAALILKQIDPTFAARDVMSILRMSGVDNFDGDKEATPHTQLSFPRLDVDNAIAVALTRKGGQASAALVGVNGLDTGIQFDRDGVLYSAWYDGSDQHLKFATKNVNGDWSAVRVIDATGNVGQFLSLAMTSTGKPALSYYQAGEANLKYAEWNGARWNVQTVESRLSVGLYTSMTFDEFDDPIVTYYYKNGGDLRLAFNDGSGWAISVVDSAGDVGRYSSVALSKTGQWSVAYEATGTGDFKFAKKVGGSWVTQFIDTSTRTGGGHTSLAYTPANLPAVSYYDAYNANLKFAYFNGSQWRNSTIASKFIQGLFTNLFFNSAGNPLIVYYNRTRDSVFLASQSAGAWGLSELGTDGGRYVTVSRYGNSKRILTYLQAGSADLVFRSF